MHAYILLDRSGSMGGLWDEALTSINTYVKDMPKGSKATVVLFDGNNGPQFDIVRDKVAKSKFTPLTREDGEPRGFTPLYDSTAKIIDKMIEDDNRKAVLVVMTDGAENDSREYSLEAVKAKIDTLKERDWAILMMGANFQDVKVVSSSYNLAAGNTVNVTPGKFRDFTKVLSEKTALYATASAEASMTWSDKDKKRFA